MSTNKTLLFTNNTFNYITNLSDTKNYQDGLNNIRRDMELIGESDESIHDRVCQWIEIELEDLLGQFEVIQDVLVAGALGLWNGRHNIEPTRLDNLKDAFCRCVNNVDNVEVYNNNGVIEVNAYHHDGCNRFSIYQLNSKGVNAGDNADLEKKSYHKKIRLYQ